MQNNKKEPDSHPTPEMHNEQDASKLIQDIRNRKMHDEQVVS